MLTSPGRHPPCSTPSTERESQKPPRGSLPTFRGLLNNGHTAQLCRRRTGFGPTAVLPPRTPQPFSFGPHSYPCRAPRPPAWGAEIAGWLLAGPPGSPPRGVRPPWSRAGWALTGALVPTTLTSPAARDLTSTSIPEKVWLALCRE